MTLSEQGPNLSHVEPGTEIPTEIEDSRPLGNNCNRTGLVLSAGGAKGAYQIGVWKALIEKKLFFDAFSGSSIGSLNSALICQGDWDKAYRLWMEMHYLGFIRPDRNRLAKMFFTMASDIGLMFLPVPNIKLLRLLKPLALGIKMVSRYGIAGVVARDGFIDMSSFQPFVSQYLDMQSLLDCRKIVYMCVYEAPRLLKPFGETRFIQVQKMTKDEAWLVLAASTSLPFIFSTVSIADVRLTDGGIGSHSPLEPLLKSNLQEIYVVSSDRKFKPRTYPHASTPLTIFQPTKPLGRFPLATFGFARDNIERWIETGYSDASQILSGL